MKRLLLLALGLMALAAQPVSAAEWEETGSSFGGCLMAAANLHHLSPQLLIIVLNVENGRLGKVSPNTNRTVDIGPMQVNDSWVSKLAAHWHARQQDTYEALRDNFCANIEGGAWILRQALDEAKGDLWEGVALYHSHTSKHKQDYLHLVLAQILRLRREALTEVAQASQNGR
jgi:soluble lytic murein transglycosylase-like protein